MMNAQLDFSLLEQMTEHVRLGLASVRRTIESASTAPERITIIGVTKGWGPEAVLAGLANGLVWFGENYADELVAKAAAVQLALSEGVPLDDFPSPVPNPMWTFQGRLQTNKINRLKELVQLWQTLDTQHHVTALATRVPGAEVLVQVALDPSGDRGGCPDEQVLELVLTARNAGLRVSGLMGVAPDISVHGMHAASSAFAKLQHLAGELSLPVISMGMSDDYGLALASGATHLRLGSVLFGSRT